MPKISGPVRTFDDCKLMLFHIDDDKLLEECKNIQRKGEKSKSVGLTALGQVHLIIANFGLYLISTPPAT